MLRSLINRPKSVLIRNVKITTSAPIDQLSRIEPDEEYPSAKSYKDVPKVSAFTILSTFASDKKRLVLDEHFKRHHDRLGPIFKFSVLGQTDRVWINNPVMIQKVLSKDGKYPIEPAFDHLIWYRQKHRKELFSGCPGLVGTNHGEEWWNLRKLVQQIMMRPESALFYIKNIEAVTQDFVDHLEASRDGNNEVDDLIEYIHNWALESIGASFLNTRLGCFKPRLPEDEITIFIEAVQAFHGPDFYWITVGPPVWKLITTPAFRRWDESQVTMYDFTKKHVDRAIDKYLKEGVSDPKNMSVLEKLIEECGPDSQIPIVLSQDSLIGGVDTTSTSASFMLLDLAQNPECQDKLHKEITDIIGDGPITDSKIKQMRYLRACFQEAMRLHPPIIGFLRQTQVDMALEGYQIPKGTMVNLFTMNIAKDPQQFKDPDKFIPERWIRGDPDAHDAHPFASLPFGHGPRMCLGRRFAELENYILGIKMIQKFKLEYHYEPVGVQTDFVHKPDKKIKLRMINRK